MSVTETFGRFNASDPIGLQPTLFLCPILFISPLLPNTQTNERTNERKKKKRRKTKRKRTMASLISDTNGCNGCEARRDPTERKKLLSSLPPRPGRMDERQSYFCVCVCSPKNPPPVSLQAAGGRYRHSAVMSIHVRPKLIGYLAPYKWLTHMTLLAVSQRHTANKFASIEFH